MKVCLIAKDFPPDFGGISTQTFLLASWLSKKKIDVTVLTIGEDYEEKLLNEFKIIRLAVPMKSQLKKATYFQFKVWKWLKNNDFDVIQFQESTGFVYYMFNILNKRNNTIYTFHHSSLSELRFYLKFFFKIPRQSLVYLLFTIYMLEELFCLKRATKIVTVSNYSRSVLLSWRMDPKKINVIFNGLNCNNKNEASIFKEIQFIFVGRLVPRKGLDVVINAFETLSKNKVNFKLNVVGDGPLKDYYEKEIKKNGLKNIKMLGKISDKELKKIYENSDVFICPSYLEGFGIVLLEASCNNLAILASDIGVFKEIFDEDEVLYFRNGDSEDLAKKIIYLSKNSNEIVKLQKKAKKKAKKFSLDQSFEKYIELYSSIVRGK